MKIPYSPAPPGEEALVDSGSGHNLFSLEIAELCRVNLRNAGRAKLSTYKPDENEQQGIVAEMNYELRGCKWTAETIFVDTSKEYGLLGQLGFFNHFNVTFRYQQRFIDIEHVAN